MASISTASLALTQNLSSKYHNSNINDSNTKNLVVSPLCATHTFDVVIVGAGIIGLTIARQFLHHSDLSVAIVDAATPCFHANGAATGAGQGYIWMTNRTPGTPLFDLGMRSHKLWHSFIDSIQEEGVDPFEALGWKKKGSLVFSTNEEELNLLKRRVQQLSDLGLKAQFLSYSDLAEQEPELEIGQDSGAAFLPNDSQLDAYRTVAYIEKGNRLFASLYHKEDMPSSIMTQQWAC